MFGEDEVDGVDGPSLRVSPTVNLTYAVFDGLAAVATDPAAIGELTPATAASTSATSTSAPTDGFPDEVSLLAFLDLGDLVALGEQRGLAEDPVYATFAGDIRRLDGARARGQRGDGLARHRRAAADRRDAEPSARLTPPRLASD